MISIPQDKIEIQVEGQADRRAYIEQLQGQIQRVTGEVAGRCIFHKLRNLWQDLVIPQGLARQVDPAYKRRLIRQAAQIWQAPHVTEARERQPGVGSRVTAGRGHPPPRL